MQSELGKNKIDGRITIDAYVYVYFDYVLASCQMVKIKDQ